MTSLRRIILTFKGEEIVIHTLFQTSKDLGPSTKARRQDVTELTLAGLRSALESLRAGDVVVAGTSGFTQREDILCVDTKQGVA
jgi:hypothetical protein